MCRWNRRVAQRLTSCGEGNESAPAHVQQCHIAVVINRYRHSGAHLARTVAFLPERAHQMAKCVYHRHSAGTAIQHIESVRAGGHLEVIRAGNKKRVIHTAGHPSDLLDCPWRRPILRPAGHDLDPGRVNPAGRAFATRRAGRQGERAR